MLIQRFLCQEEKRQGLAWMSVDLDGEAGEAK